MLDQAQQTSKAIHNILVLYKISMYTRPIRKYGRGQTNYKNVSPNRLISPNVYGPRGLPSPRTSWKEMVVTYNLAEWLENKQIKKC
jgi:hypothetical protein